MEYPQLIGPKEFKEKFAPRMGLAAIRDLFKKDGFPSVQVGERYYTTEPAAQHYLENLGLQ